MIPQPHLKMELFCRRKCMDHILGHDALPYSVPFQSSPTLLHFLSCQEGNLHRAFLQTEWNVEFTLCCLLSWFRNTGAGRSWAGGGRAASEQGQLDQSEARPLHIPIKFGNEQGQFPVMAGRRWWRATPLSSGLFGFHAPLCSWDTYCMHNI